MAEEVRKAWPRRRWRRRFYYGRARSSDQGAGVAGEFMEGRVLPECAPPGQCAAVPATRHEYAHGAPGRVRLAPPPSLRLNHVDQLRSPSGQHAEVGESSTSSTLALVMTTWPNVACRTAAPSRRNAPGLQLDRFGSEHGSCLAGDDEVHRIADLTLANHHGAGETSRACSRRTMSAIAAAPSVWKNGTSATRSQVFRKCRAAAPRRRRWR